MVFRKLKTIGQPRIARIGTNKVLRKLRKIGVATREIKQIDTNRTNFSGRLEYYAQKLRFLEKQQPRIDRNGIPRKIGIKRVAAREIAQIDSNLTNLNGKLGYYAQKLRENK